MATDSDPVVTVIVTRSAGSDGALLIMVDTYEHIGQASRPLRILVNDEPVFADVDFESNDDGDDMGREARDVTVHVTEEQVAYWDDLET